MSENGSSGWSGLLDDDDAEAAPRPAAPQRRRRPIPADDAPAVRTDDLTLSPPKTAPSLSLPVPGGARPQVEVSPEPLAPGPSLDFGLQEHLSEPATATEPTESVWVEYREVILSVVGAIVLLAGALYYTHSGEEDVVTIEGTPKVETPPPVATPPPEKVATPTPTPVTTPTETKPPPTKTRTPMLSVVSEPAGAMVEINGVVYGRTPLIMPSPEMKTLTLVLRADDHKSWSRQLVPDETGHFAVNAKLEPMQP